MLQSNHLEPTGVWLLYNSFFWPKCSRWPRVALSPQFSRSHYISTFQIHLMDYPDQSFTELKYTDAYLLLIQRGQFHLDSHTDLISTWLHSITFHHWVRNSNDLILKYSELLTSHHDGLRSEGYLYPYPSWATLDSRVLSTWSCSMWRYFYILSVCHNSISTLLD